MYPTVVLCGSCVRQSGASLSFGFVGVDPFTGRRFVEVILEALDLLRHDGVRLPRNVRVWEGHRRRGVRQVRGHGRFAGGGGTPTDPYVVIVESDPFPDRSDEEFFRWSAEGWGDLPHRPGPPGHPPSWPGAPPVGAPESPEDPDEQRGHCGWVSVPGMGDVTIEVGFSGTTTEEIKEKLGAAWDVIEAAMKAACGEDTPDIELDVGPDGGRGTSTAGPIWIGDTIFGVVAATFGCKRWECEGAEVLKNPRADP